MATIIRLDEDFAVPTDVQSLGDFRVWTASDSFPERGRIDFLGSWIEVDTSPEDLLTHGKVKVELVRALAQRVAPDELGELFTDRARLTCPDAELSSEPDVVFVSEESLRMGRARLVPQAGGGADRYVEIEGAADLVVEIVSDRSVAKDTGRLPPRYFAAGVREFWLVDARGEEVVFRIHRRGAERFEAVAADGEGFQPSGVLDRRYRLDRRRNRHGRLAFQLLDAPL